MRLSFGFVRDNTLRCIYHGWGYAPDGQCTIIPAHPDLKPPKTICANSYPSQARYGIVWTNLSKAPSAPPPDLGPDEGWTPIRSLFLSRPAERAADAIRALHSRPAETTMLSDNIASVQLAADLNLLIAIQPIDAETSGLHVVARGTAAATIEGRLALAQKLERLRNEIEIR
jgi:hypothetical protein